MIRDTSAQDQSFAPTATAAPWKRWLWPGLAALVVLLAIGFAIRAWLGASRSVDSSRVRIAEVTKGDLVRDIAADGRVIAANSPVLYAISAGTVDLKVVAGDVVKKGQELAVIDSPELRSKLAQEQATLAGKPRPAAPSSTPPWPGPRHARTPTRPASSGRPPNATCSATSAAMTAARCRRSTSPRPTTP